MRRRRIALLIVATVALIGLGSLILSWRFAPPPAHTDASLPQTCTELVFEGEAYVICEVTPKAYAISVSHNDAKSKATATVVDFAAARTLAGRAPVLVMNAGMYDWRLNPIGLLVEDGQTLKPLNRREGPGNFHLMPNGVFFVDAGGRAGVTASDAWSVQSPTAQFATQSGPMLVIKGALHPAFEPNGRSRYRRNGVGVRTDGTVVLAISRDVVSFGAFARLFRDRLNCPDALFLDGAVSALAGPDGAVVGGTFPAGPVIVVDRKGR